jgi:hypothetical protein
MEQTATKYFDSNFNLLESTADIKNIAYRVVSTSNKVEVTYLKHYNEKELFFAPVSSPAVIDKLLALS